MEYMGWREKKLKRICYKMGDSITGLTDITGSTKPSPLFYLLADRMSYLLAGDADQVLSESTVRLRRRLNGILKFVGPLFLEHRQVFESKNALLGIDYPDEPSALPEEPVIWCANHSFKDDILATVLACRHAYILFGSLPAYFNTFDGISAFINGVIMCNRKLAASRRSSTENARRVLEMGADLMLFPEGVWNKTSERLLLDFWPGIYRIAKATGAKVVPVVHYIRNTEDPSPENVIHTVVDEPLRLDDLPEKEALSLLRDRMATWYYLMMERYGKSTRQELLSDFSSSEEAWEDYIAEHTRSIYYYDKEIEFSADCRPWGIPLPQDVYRQVADIQKITPDNASTVAAAVRIVEQARKRDVQRRY